MVKTFLKRNKKTIFTVLLIIIATVLIYYAAIQPLLGMLVFDTVRTEGISNYEQKKHLDLEDGEIFDDWIKSLGFPEKCTATNFIHYDNRYKDNLIYGKFSDVFMLEMETDEELYLELKNLYAIDGNYFGCELNGFEFYETNTEEASETEGFGIGFNDSEYKIRCVYINDIPPSVLGKDLLTIIYRASSLDKE